MTFVGATIIEYKDQDTSFHRICHSDGNKERIGLKGRPNVSMTLKMNLNQSGKQILEDINKRKAQLPHWSRLKYLPIRGLLPYALTFCSHPLVYCWRLKELIVLCQRERERKEKNDSLLVEVVLAATAPSRCSSGCLALDMIIVSFPGHDSQRGELCKESGVRE